MYAANGDQQQEQPSIIWMPGLQYWANSLPWPINAGFGLVGACAGLIVGLRFGGDNVQWAGALLGVVFGWFFMPLLVLVFRVVTQLAFIGALLFALYFIGLRIANSSKYSQAHSVVPTSTQSIQEQIK